MTISLASDFPTYSSISNFLTPKQFTPELYGYRGTWPITEWHAQTSLYFDYFSMVSGTILDTTETMSGNLIYPVKANVWDFIASIHAYMSMGEDKNQQPRTTFVGEGAWDRVRADRYNRFVAKSWANSSVDLFSLFWNINAYGAYAMVVRYDLKRKFPIFYEPIPAGNFFPVLDSGGKIIEFFIFRAISHSEARWRYGVTIDASSQPYYIEYWNPEEYEVRINGYMAHTGDAGERLIQGRNIFGIAPAVYIPHLRKQNKYGDSQLQGTKEQGLEFNSRLADVSDGVREQMKTSFVGTNIKTPKAYRVGDQTIWNIGDSMDLRESASIQALSNSTGIKDSNAFVDSLWSMLTTFAYIPPIAMGVDEGSQRSSLTLRTRFWLLESHCGVERHNLSEQLIRLAHMTIIGLSQMGYPDVTTNGLSLEATVQWPEMLPEDRAELLNEMIQRYAAGIISRRRAISKFGDVEDVEAEAAEIDADEKRKQQAELVMMKAEAALRPKPASSGSKK